ncbi:hypothetical protein [Rhizobium sp. NPDC090279]|uniref:hypothetical protein n=1 Tax=Rhizobium sp. NPDC090279 TaxID=3364499 RepID=UPI00383BF601
MKEQVGLATAIETELQKSSIEAAGSRYGDLENEITTSTQQIATLEGRSAPAADLLKPQPQPQPVDPTGRIEGRPTNLLRSQPDVRRAELAVTQTVSGRISRVSKVLTRARSTENSRDHSDMRTANCIITVARDAPLAIGQRIVVRVLK